MVIGSEKDYTTGKPRRLSRAVQHLSLEADAVGFWPSFYYREGSNFSEIVSGVKVSGSAPIDCYRGKIQGFSRRSRSRLMFRLAELRRDKMPVFGTLTFKDNVQDSTFAKRCLRAYVKRLRRRFPRFACVWRMEYQDRGAIHFHLLAWGISLPSDRGLGKVFYRYLQGLWNQVVGQESEASTRFEKIRSYRGVLSYAGKYLAKDDDQVREDGRVWGTENSSGLPRGEMKCIVVSSGQATRILCAMKRRQGGEAQSHYLERLRHIGLPEAFLDLITEGGDSVDDKGHGASEWGVCL